MPPVPPAMPGAAAPPAGTATSPSRPASAGGDPHAPSLQPGAAADGHDGNALPPGTLLGEFELTGVIGEGGFGIVYAATDHSLQRRVALKEYMPSSLAERTDGTQVRSLSEEDEATFRKGLDSFINEARLLAQFDHPSLVKVHRFWEANGTAYMVMPLYEGPTLREVLRKRSTAPDEAWLRALLEPLTEALAVIHAQQCYHRDIAPDNVLLLAGSNRPLLLDFGAARRVIGDKHQAFTVMLKPGYTPIEQYADMPDMAQGPWTDIYALGAVVHFAILGQKPAAAVSRLLKDQYVPLAQQVGGHYSAGFLDAIDRSLALKPADRPQDILAFRDALGFGPLPSEGGRVWVPSALPVDTTRRPGPQDALPAAPAAAPLPTPPRPSPRPAPAPADTDGGDAEPPPSRRAALLTGVGLAAVAVGAGGWWMASRQRGPAPAVASAPPAGPAASAGVPASRPVPAVAPPASVAAPAPAPAVPAGPFDVVAEFRRIVAGQTPGFSVEARPTRTQLRIDRDKLFVSINASRDGHFYVLSLAPDGQLIQFFPNLQTPSNQIVAGASLTLPSATKDPQTGRLPDDIVLTEPPGQAHLLVLVSRYPRDFSLLGEQRVSHWREFPTGAKAEAIARRQPPGAPSIYAGRPICPGGGCADEYGAALVDFAVVR
ncbi:serine/threonine protein kinase [Piscinibacter sakaiensis]|uniref:Serine/threonine protein kinase n=2 Tax=Piscinibacter sakaiensis TaxID=1547922 RepID=A0A0K8P103_PISS1|nr:serine/threonine protein kinase [Piscinibacter sakaiensis]